MAGQEGHFVNLPFASRHFFALAGAIVGHLMNFPLASRQVCLFVLVLFLAPAKDMAGADAIRLPISRRRKSSSW